MDPEELEEGEVASQEAGQENLDLKAMKQKKKSKKSKSRQVGDKLSSPPESKASTTDSVEKIEKKVKTDNKPYVKRNKNEFTSSTYKTRPCEFIEKVVCKYFLTGNCSKGDNCMFSHDLKKYPCKFWWGPGNCTQGAQCRFSHEPIRDEQKIMDFIEENEDYFMNVYQKQGRTNLGNYFLNYLQKKAADQNKDSKSQYLLLPPSQEPAPIYPPGQNQYPNQAPGVNPPPFTNPPQQSFDPNMQPNVPPSIHPMQYPNPQNNQQYPGNKPGFYDQNMSKPRFMQQPPPPNQNFQAKPLPMPGQHPSGHASAIPSHPSSIPYQYPMQTGQGFQPQNTPYNPQNQFNAGPGPGPMNQMHQGGGPMYQPTSNISQIPHSHSHHNPQYQVPVQQQQQQQQQPHIQQPLMQPQPHLQVQQQQQQPHYQHQAQTHHQLPQQQQPQMPPQQQHQPPLQQMHIQHPPLQGHQQHPHQHQLHPQHQQQPPIQHQQHYPQQQQQQQQPQLPQQQMHPPYSHGSSTFQAPQKIEENRNFPPYNGSAPQFRPSNFPANTQPVLAQYPKGPQEHNPPVIEQQISSNDPRKRLGQQSINKNISAVPPMNPLEYNIPRNEIPQQIESSINNPFLMSRGAAQTQNVSMPVYQPPPSTSIPILVGRSELVPEESRFEKMQNEPAHPSVSGFPPGLEQKPEFSSIRIDEKKPAPPSVSQSVSKDIKPSFSAIDTRRNENRKMKEESPSPYDMRKAFRKSGQPTKQYATKEGRRPASTMPSNLGTKAGVVLTPTRTRLASGQFSEEKSSQRVIKEKEYFNQNMLLQKLGIAKKKELNKVEAPGDIEKLFSSFEFYSEKTITPLKSSKEQLHTSINETLKSLKEVLSAE